MKKNICFDIHRRHLLGVGDFEGLGELARCSAVFMTELRWVHPTHRLLVMPSLWHSEGQNR